MATPSKVDKFDKHILDNAPLSPKKLSRKQKKALEDARILDLTQEEKEALRIARNLERFNQINRENAPLRPKKLTPEQKKALEDAGKRTRGKRIRLQLRL